MILIAAVDKNWGIGKNNQLLYHLPEDMAFFKQQTIGKTILMGRKTLESFKNSKPLPKRKNIVLTRQKIISKYKNLEYIDSIDNITLDDSVMLIGGSSIYNQYFNLCSHAFITKIDMDEIEPDVYFPNLDNYKNWKIEEIIAEGVSENGIKYKILKYKNTEV